jgi:hypothetical protein
MCGHLFVGLLYKYQWSENSAARETKMWRTTGFLAGLHYELLPVQRNDAAMQL